MGTPGKYRNIDGMTLIEVLMIAGLLAIMIAGFASYQFNRSKEQKTADLRRDYNTLQISVNNAVNQPETSTSTEEMVYPNPSP